MKNLHPRFGCWILLWLAVAALNTEHCLLNTSLAAPASSRPPNFIVILADDLGAKELGCYGSTRHQTPNLDRMAAEGLRFETFFATPLCTPTRVQLMTGQYGFRTGYLGMNNKAFIPAPGSP
jgi:arylsulfatase A